MRHLDLFSGIGGFALAARKVGWQTVGFCEIDPYCQKVLAKHWPGVPIYEDVRGLPYDSIGPVGIITGGYPCQGESLAGKRLGKEDDRWLGEAFTDAVEIIRPKYAIGENVAGHITLGLDTVLSNLERIGYTTETFVIPACAVDARHRRDRVWVIGSDTSSEGSHKRKLQRRVQRQEEQEEQEDKRKTSELGSQARSREVLADTECRGRQGSGQHEQPCDTAQGEDGEATESFYGGVGAKWSFEPNVGRVANGIPRRVDRLRGLGNAIVPQVAEVIFRAINELESNGVRYE